MKLVVPLWSSLIAFFFPLIIYTLTLYPTVPGGDSGEVIVEAHILGNAHPPGYPLFVMVGHLFSNYLLPIREVAWRLNFMSALFASTGALFLHLFIVELCAPLWATADEVVVKEEVVAVKAEQAAAEPTTGSGTTTTSSSKEKEKEVKKKVLVTTVVPGPAQVAPLEVLAGSLAGSLLFSFSPLTWFYSIQAEVFAVNNMFVALVLYLTMRYLTRTETWVLLVGALAVGLGLTNQHTLVFYAIPLVLAILWHGRRVVFTSAKVFFGCGLLGLLGLSPYLFMVWSTARVTQGSWGDCTTWEGFRIHFLREEYGTFKLFSADEVTEGMVERLEFYGRDLSLQSLGLGVAAVALGFVLVIVPGSLAAASREAKARPVPSAFRGAVVLAAYAFYQIVFHALANLPLKSSPLKYGVHQRFWMQPNAIAFSVIGFLIAFVMVSGLPRLGFARDHARAVAATVALALVLAQVGAHYRVLDQSGNRQLLEYGRVSLEHMPQRSLLLTHGDIITNAPRYLQQAMGVRPDIVSLNVDMATYEWWGRHHKNYPGVVFPNWHYHPFRTNGFGMKEFLDANFDRFTIFTCQGFRDGDTTYQPYYELLPFGLCTLVVKRGTKPPFKGWWKIVKKIFEEGDRQYLPSTDFDRYDNTTWEFTAYSDYYESKAKAGYMLLMYALEKTPADERILNLTRTFLEDTIAKSRLPPSAFTAKNLGIAYTRLADQSPRWVREGAVKYFGMYITSKEAADDKDLPVLKDFVTSAQKSLDLELAGYRIDYGKGASGGGARGGDPLEDAEKREAKRLGEEEAKRVKRDKEKKEKERKEKEEKERKDKEKRERERKEKEEKEKREKEKRERERKEKEEKEKREKEKRERERKEKERKEKERKEKEEKERKEKDKEEQRKKAREVKPEDTKSKK